MKKIDPHYILAAVCILALFWVFWVKSKEIKPINTDRPHLVDSLKSSFLKEKIQISDSLTLMYENRLLEVQLSKKKIQASNNSLREENKRIRRKYTESPTPENCDSLVNAQDELITGLETEIDTLNAEAESYSKIVVGQKHRISLTDSLVITKQNHIDQCEKINTELQKQLRKKDNWWSRNHKWLFFGAGVFIGYKVL